MAQERFRHPQNRGKTETVAYPRHTQTTTVQPVFRRGKNNACGFRGIVYNQGVINEPIMFIKWSRDMKYYIATDRDAALTEIELSGTFESEPENPFRIAEVSPPQVVELIEDASEEWFNAFSNLLNAETLASILSNNVILDKVMALDVAERMTEEEGQRLYRFAVLVTKLIG